MAEAPQSMAGSVSDGGGVNISLATSTGFVVSAIIVAVIIFVFVFYRCLRAHECWGANPVSFGNHVPAAFAAEQRSSAGLDVASIKALPVTVFCPDEFKVTATECCAVCLCELVAGETARLLPNCNHAFHVKCIDMWFYSHSTCPLCRTPAAVHQKFSKDAGAGDAKARPVEPQPNSLSSTQAGSSSSSSGRSLDYATEARTPRRRPGEVVQTPSPQPVVEEIMSPLTSLRRLLRPGSRVVGDASTARDIEQGCAPKSPTSFINDRFI